MRNHLGMNKVITNASEFYRIAFDHKMVQKQIINNYDFHIKKEISAIVDMSDEVIRVIYKHKKDFVGEHASSNIIISLWTTSILLLDF